MTPPRLLGEVTEYSCPWFELVAKRVGYDVPTGEQVFLGVRGPDCVSILAVTPEGSIPLVRQYRPVIGQTTLELPSGHVERNEHPEDAARRELTEETGFVATDMVLLGRLIADSGRLEYSQWCYFAPHARPAPQPRDVEADIEIVLCPPGGVRPLIERGEFAHAQHLAAFALAILQGRLEP